MSTTDDYDYYLSRLAGGRPTWTEDKPQAGLFRHFKGEPAQIRRDKGTGELVAFLGSETVDPAWLWPAVAEHCVSKADYKARVESGAWPGEQPVARETVAVEKSREEMHADYCRSIIQHIKACGMGVIDGCPQPLGILLHELESKVVIDDSFGDLKGEALAALGDAMKTLLAAQEKQFGQPGHNSGATVSEFDQLREDAETRLQDAEKLLFSVGDAVKPGDEVTATKLKDEAAFIDSKLKPLEALRKAEKKPHDDAAAAVQAKFKPIIDKLDTAKRKLLARVDAWTRAEDKRRRDEHAKAVAEANRKAVEEQAANKAAEPVAVEAPPPPAPIKIGTIGDKRGVRKVKMRAEVTDWAAAFADPLIADDPAVRAAAQKIADKLADINATKPWFKRVEA